MEQDLRKQKMLLDPIKRIIPAMAIPTIIAFLINSIYSLADTYFVSGLGTEATAAVGVNSSLDQLIMMCGSLLAIGANSYIARLLGKGDDKKASQVLSTAFFLALGIGVVLMACGTIWMYPMVRFLGATPTCEQYAVDYATYVLMAAPFMAASFVMNQCLRSEGSAMLSMIGMSFGGVLNCVLDPIFILNEGDLLFGAIPMPFGFDMGVAGASLATAISKVVSFAILIWPYISKRSVLRLGMRYFRLAKDIMVEIISVGASSMFRSGLAVVAAILLNDMAGEISDSVLAGISVCTKIMMFPFSIILGFGTGFQPVAGFNWGAERYDRVRESYRFSSIVAVIGAAIMAVVLAIFAEPVIGWFSGAEIDAEMQKIGTLCIVTQCISLPVHAWVAVVNMYCNGLGNAGGAFLLATSRQGTCFIPILFPLAAKFGAWGLASVQGVADVLSLVFAIPMAIYMAKKVKRAAQAKGQNALVK